MKNIKPLTFPFNSENNTSIKQSLFRFREYFDSSTIVGLGENAHFIKEFFTFRHQVIEFLVSYCHTFIIQMSLKILCYGFVGIIKTIIIKLPF